MPVANALPRIMQNITCRQHSNRSFRNVGGRKQKAGKGFVGVVAQVASGTGLKVHFTVSGATVAPPQVNTGSLLSKRSSTGKAASATLASFQHHKPRIVF